MKKKETRGIDQKRMNETKGDVQRVLEERGRTGDGQKRTKDREEVRVARGF